MYIKLVVGLTYLNTLEKYHIYKTKKTGHLLNDIYADTYNLIYEFLFKFLTHLKMAIMAKTLCILCIYFYYTLIIN
jgi:hypothetical protein